MAVPISPKGKPPQTAQTLQHHPHASFLDCRDLGLVSPVPFKWPVGTPIIDTHYVCMPLSANIINPPPSNPPRPLDLSGVAARSTFVLGMGRESTIDGQYDRTS